MRLIDADVLKEMIPTTSVDMYENCRNCSLLSEEQVLELIDMTPTIDMWIPCSERLPEEDHWLGGSGRQFSDEVLVSVANYDDEDIWTYISQTIDGEWALELPSHCKIIAWMPLPEPYTERREDG